MAKHTILYGCGHIAAAEVEGNEYEQQEKLDYLKICGRCPACEKHTGAHIRRFRKRKVTHAALDFRHGFRPAEKGSDE